MSTATIWTDVAPRRHSGDVTIWSDVAPMVVGITLLWSRNTAAIFHRQTLIGSESAATALEAFALRGKDPNNDELALVVGVTEATIRRHRP